MYEDLIEWLESHQQPCFYKKTFGIDCPGCGMQRAIIELLKGNFIESFKEYPALIPIVFVISFLILHLIFKFKKGAFIIKISFIFTCAIIVINYVIKVINSNIF